MSTTQSHATSGALERYGTVFSRTDPFFLESGAILPRLDIAYTTLGRLNSDGTNAILVCHALTGHAHAADALGDRGMPIKGWFHGMIGPTLGLDTERYYVICSNILGSCYGSTGPMSIDPTTGAMYRMAFPQMNIRDMVRAEKLLLEHLGVNRIVTVIGGSLGGMQALEWAVLYPDMVESIIPIAASAQHSAWCIGIGETQRLAIMSDPAWCNGDYTEQPAHGLAIARAIAMISYRSQLSFEERFGRKIPSAADGHQRISLFREFPLFYSVESYLRYQGQKLVERFDANSYLYLTRAMDLHDLGAGRAPLKDVLGSLTAHTLSIGISSDILYPPQEQQTIAASVPEGRYVEITSRHGHDAFLIEFEQMNAILREFLPSDGGFPRATRRSL